MPADHLLEALRAIDTRTLQVVAVETGIGETTLWRYRRAGAIPPSRRRPLERALGLPPERFIASVESEVYPSVAELERERQRPTPKRPNPGGAR